MEKKKSRKRKNRTKKFILLLFLTIIMLGTSTYAWFTANETVTINPINVRVEATNGIQISTNADDWKSVITTSDITTGYTNAQIQHTNQLPATVTNVSTDGTVSSGRLVLYYGVIGNDASTGAYTIRTTTETDVAGTSGRYVAFDVFLRVDQTQDVYLTTDSNVVANGENKGLKNAARVGFVKLGHGESTDSVVNLTKLNNINTTKAIIWEPNMDQHQAKVTDTVAPEYGVNIPTNGTYVTYRGINSPIANPVDLKSVVNMSNTTYTGVSTPDIRTAANFQQYQYCLRIYQLVLLKFVSICGLKDKISTVRTALLVLVLHSIFK